MLPHWSILFVVALILWFVYDRIRYSHYPPGPLRIPLLGNIIQVSKLSPLPAVAFQKLAEVYGDVVFVRLGLKDVLTFNTYETARDILAHECTAERSQDMLPLVWERILHKNLGVIFSNGKVWQTLRRYTIRTLRDFGFGKETNMDVVINEEVDSLIEHLKYISAASNDGVVNKANELFDLTVVNVLWRLVTGVKYKLTDSKMLHYVKLNHALLKTTNFAVDLAIAFPFLYHIFPNWLRKNDQIKSMKRLRDFFQEIIQSRRMLGEYKTSSNCYVDEFLTKIDANKGNPETEFNDEQLIICLLDLFQAGSDTTSNTLSFCVLYMLVYPEIQEKVQKEIDSVIAKSESITMSTRQSLPYTHATLLECIRCSTVLPNTPARQASKDFYFNGHFIKKGIILTANLYAVHHSKDVWGDPQNFRPERFLNEEGSVDNDIAIRLLPFGNGNRRCLAAGLAETSLHIYFTSLLRNFKIMKAPENADLSLVPDLAITLYPKPYKAKFVWRG